MLYYGFMKNTRLNRLSVMFYFLLPNPYCIIRCRNLCQKGANQFCYLTPMVSRMMTQVKQYIL